MRRSPNRRILAAERMASQARSPAWIITFADLNSLLLAFFLLLFAFSEQDKAKFEQVAGSMRDTFRVPQEVGVQEPPKGTRLISPAGPSPTARDQPRQLMTGDPRPGPVQPKPPASHEAADERQRLDKASLAKALKPEIDAGLIELELEDDRIVIRIKENGVFPSGSNHLERTFEPIMQRLANTLADTAGTIVVAGHTDSIPIANSAFNSNWQLSTARALAVAQVFFASSEALMARVHLESYAEFQPIDSNDTPEGRARNRRVEISLIHPTAPPERVLAPTARPSEGPPAGAAPQPKPTRGSPLPAVKADTSAPRRGPADAKGIAPATEVSR